MAPTYAVPGLKYTILDYTMIGPKVFQILLKSGRKLREKSISYLTLPERHHEKMNSFESELGPS